MSKKTRVSHPIYSLLPTDVEGFDSLAELALDMRWSWNHATDGVWRALDPILWNLTQNPWVVLQTVSRDQLEHVLADPAFRKNVDDHLRAKREAAERPAWFQQKHPQAPLTCVAYFCMEFMLSEALPIYSGGLGNVAGDQLKAASDLGVPVVGVGLLYQQGYFRQVIDKNGAQQALYPYNDPGQLPITPLRQPNGEWLRLEIALPGYSVWLRAWQVQAGRVKLYLLDSNDAANIPIHRGITSELYGGGPELRLKQEMLLGIGGWRLLRALGIKPEVCHLNEGHAAFATLERARNFMEETGQPFEVALAATRAGNLFTTHTPVAAGFDLFDPALIEQYLGGYAEKKLGITLHDLLALGRQNPNDSSETFNMAYLAIRGSGAVNGVSRLQQYRTELKQQGKTQRIAATDSRHSLRRSPDCQIGHVESLRRVVRVPAAKGQQIAERDAEFLLRISAKVLFDESRSEQIKAGGHWRVGGEEVPRSRGGQRDFEGLPGFFHKISGTLQHGEGRMSFIQVTDFRLDAQRAEQSPAANPEKHFLHEAQLRPAPI